MMTTIASTLQFCTDKLDGAGIENARFEARLLVCHVLNIETQILIGYPERPLDDDAFAEIQKLLMRRVSREPMSHILGEREFWSLNFKVSKDTLTPRPDSETLIEAALRYFPNRDADLRFLDLGVGTGCLLLSCLSEYPKATGLGIDISNLALKVATENADSLNLSKRVVFQQGNWAEGLSGQFDLILSNPPYIPEVDRDKLEPEVKDHEPATALFAGHDGLDDYRKLAKVLFSLLKTDGKAIIELGIGQAEAVSTLMKEQNLEVLERAKDLGGIIRCLVLAKKL